MCTYLFVYSCLFLCISASLDFHLAFMKGHLEWSQRLTQEGSTLFLCFLSPNPNFRLGVCGFWHILQVPHRVFCWCSRPTTHTFSLLIWTYETYCFEIVKYTVCYCLLMFMILLYYWRKKKCQSIQIQSCNFTPRIWAVTFCTGLLCGPVQ